MKRSVVINTSKGFTLIELVVVIVILGILAATAAPKFIDLKSDAQTATLEGVKASLEGAAALVHSKSIVAGNHNEEVAIVSLADGDFFVSYGYPLVPPSGASDYWKRIIDVGNDFTIYVVTGGVLVIYPSDMPQPADSNGACLVTYAASTGEYINPIININDCI